jgi:cell division protein FtsI/penicillin-binding protein 2
VVVRLWASRWWAVAVPVLALGALLTTPSPARTAAELPVDLLQIGSSGEHLTAPLIGSSELAQLTIDPKLQRTASRLLARAHPVAGAIILAHARSGKVLVWSERKRGKRSPGAVLLRMRAPAASLFKIVTTAALLETARIAPRTEICHRGGRRRIERHHLAPPQAGNIHCGPFRDALGHSHNAVYAQLTNRYLNLAELDEMALRLGFNQPLPFATRIPMGTAKLPHDELALARAAAGFEGSTLSALGALSLAYTVAAGGQTVQLRIVEQAGEYRAPRKRKVLARVLSPWTATQLRRMMEVTVHSGTSLEAFSDDSGRSYLPGIRVAGKTGTLQPSAAAPTTTWFVGFAPSRRPRVVVSVLIQNGAVWRRKANEVARDMLRAYFADRGYRGVTAPFGASG